MSGHKLCFFLTCWKDCHFETHHAWVTAKWCSVKLTPWLSIPSACFIIAAQPNLSRIWHYGFTREALNNLPSDTSVMECIDLLFSALSLFFFCWPVHWFATLNDGDEWVWKWTFLGEKMAADHVNLNRECAISELRAKQANKQGKYSCDFSAPHTEQLLSHHAASCIWPTSSCLTRNAADSW